MARGTMAGFQRRHFEALAQFMRDTKPNVRTEQEAGEYNAAYESAMLTQWRLMRERLADALNSGNANFDRQRFIDACNR